MELWHLLGSLQLDTLDLLLHLTARILCLIVVPIVLYFAIYYVHFALLTTTGPGSAFMSREFVSGLRQSVSTNEEARYVMMGSQVTLLQPDLRAYLHSHPHLYPAGSEQQQVTGYVFSDANNWFVLQPVNRSRELAGGVPPVTHDSSVFLRHFASDRGLYVHGYPAPITPGELHLEVSAYDGTGHPWRVEFLRPPLDPDAEKLGRKNHRFRLVHEDAQGRCALHVHAQVLPAWGFGQLEATCARNLTLAGTAWVVDESVSTQRTGRAGVHRCTLRPVVRSA